MTWIFLRHAQSIANAEGWLSGWKDVGLTEAGEEEAREAGRVLKTMQLDRCLVSDLKRARKTLELVLEGRQHKPAVHVLPELRERRMGILTGEKTAEIKADGRFTQLLAPWSAKPPLGESHQEATARVLACLSFWNHGGTTLVVGHGGWIRDVLAWLDSVPVEEIGRRPPALNARPIIREIPHFPRLP
jgi:broad specificity phosphatase PhoE